MHCFFCEELTDNSTIVSLNKIESQHLFKTLRGRVGDKIELINGAGVFAIAEIIEEKQLKIISVAQQLRSQNELILFLVPPKKHKMDLVLRQCAELGVSKIFLMITERSVSLPHKKNVVEKWRQNLIEGCKQSKNAYVPEISLPVKFKDIFTEKSKINFVKDINAFFGAIHGQETINLLKEKKLIEQNNSIAWFVGPEGGFTENEEQILEQNHIRPLRIGNYVLRVETAVVAGCAVLSTFFIKK